VPKNVEKGQGKKVAAETAQPDGAFDDMLAGVRAADDIATAAKSSNTISSSRSTPGSDLATRINTSIGTGSSISDNAARTSARGIHSAENRSTAEKLLEDVLVLICIRGDVARLRKGCRVSGGQLGLAS
jgi:hypothetical protein